MATKTQTQPLVEPERSELIAVNIPPGARSPKTRLITRSQIHPDPEQPREFADDELKASIATQGLLEPIIVRPHPSIMTEWMIVNGERRWRGAEGVLNDLQCIVRTDLDDPIARLAVQLVANTGKPMSPVEEAVAFRKMLDASGMSVADLAGVLGRAPSTVAERIALLELGPWLELIKAGDVVMSHAIKVLVPLRAVPDSYHEKAIALLRNDYRWQNKGKGDGISLGDFERLIEQIYRAAMYPLTKTKGYGKQPEFTTSKHDAECGCGGIKFDLGGGTLRLCCGNPGWWRPLHRAALKAKKPAGGKSSTPKGKTLYLPPDAKTVKTSYGQTPSGVTQLTDTNGQWSVERHNFDQAFDPADLAIDDRKLVSWSSDYGSGYAYVGTTDAAAVKAARAKWTARWAEEEKKLQAELHAAITKSRDKYAVDGKGAALLAGQLSGELLTAEILDVAAAFSIPVPETVFKGSSWELSNRVRKWVVGLHQKYAAEILTGIATIAGDDLVLPSQRIEQLQRKALERVRNRDIPWKTKPKPASSPKAAKKTPKAARRTPNAAFMRDMYASPALAAVIGTKGMPRTEVTKKIYAYIKKHGLQDAKNRRMINADDKLRVVFNGKAQVSMFEMTKIMNKHLAGTAEAASLIYAGKKIAAPAPAIDELNDHVANASGDLDAGDDPQFDAIVDDDSDDLWDAGTDDEDELEEVEA